ncbi:hypothetical protein Misp01_66090 [Microtetraspora sp. NBRC 13810]|uniref:hypothetical protein n=1 Tax=Microtetraspora sp. NBRC 13810 TaxID=3030990 RepID=UPI0024A39342|nr:hypothetical protein [Microtetraspora sp. NBRC 13810]GLW11481.1 hypothetical protein Misp01_66090 [Microtetraspora sp. NBRC 13810]
MLEPGASRREPPLPSPPASYRELIQAAKCGLVELSGRRELLDTFLRLFAVPQPA